MKFVLIIVVIALAIFWFKRSADNKAIAEQNIRLGSEFLEQNKQVDGVIETASGLQYQVLKKGDGNEQPSASSKVTVHYHGTLIDGTVFDSSLVRKQALSFGLNQVIRGWTEGLQLMSVGDKYKFFIHSALAYGNNAAGKIAPGSLLIFEVELLAIN